MPNWFVAMPAAGGDDAHAEEVADLFYERREAHLKRKLELLEADVEKVRAELAVVGTAKRVRMPARQVEDLDDDASTVPGAAPAVVLGQRLGTQ